MSGKKKIGYILGLDIGIHRFILRELEELERRDYTIFIFTTKINPGVYNPKPSWNTYTFHRWGSILKQPWYFIKSPIRYLRILIQSLSDWGTLWFLIANEYAGIVSREGLHHIHCHFGDAKLFIGYYLKLLTGCRLSVTIHAHELYRNRNWKLFRKALGRADDIITVSDHNRQLLITKFGTEPEKTHLIRLFVDPTADLPDTKRKILVVGSFEERKGYDDLVKAVSFLKRDDFVVWVCGEGHLPVRGWAEQAGVADKFRFFGKLHKDLLNVLYSQCDIFVLPSKTVSVKGGTDCEGIPVVLMEAMLAAKPVITTRHVGIPELVEKVLVPEASPEELAKAIGKTLDSPSSWKGMGERNRQIVLQNFSKKNFDELERILRK
ncbi:glycosyltransferase family 4 protein [Candidatus Woesearchaeota archaeon]|nr:glycosyltransferase family 4 protein [Candidatus Woesearchaeota archaeon]